MHDAEAGRFLARHLQAADGDVGAAVDVLAQHHLVIHFIDMVAGENDDEAAGVGFDDVDVLVDCIGRADIPHVFGDALARREDVEALVALGAEEVPAHLKVPDQAVRLVLGGDGDAADARVHRVRQREIDDAGFSAEIDRRLGATVGQLQQPAAASAGQDKRQRLTGKRLGSRGTHVILPQLLRSREASRPRSFGTDSNGTNSKSGRWLLVANAPEA
ncbi:hypothetical protein ACVWZK_003584 [Bradyrhizobium sp. GM0.4]